MILAYSGCASSRSGPWIHRPKTSKDYLNMALESKIGDDRRAGVVGLARSSDGKSNWAVTVYNTIAATDKDDSVRCAALDALAPVAREAEAGLCVKLLNSSARPQPDVRIAGGRVRWSAAKLLLLIVAENRFGPSQRAAIVAALLDRLSHDNDRNVRLTVIEAVAYFPQQPVPQALVDAMSAEDFAIQHSAEQSLIALTGVTHHHDIDAWRKWLSLTKDPFAHAGQIPEGMQVEQKSKRRWDWDW